MMNAGKPFRAVQGAAPVDMYDSTNAALIGRMMGAKLSAAAAAATAQLVDADGTVLGDMAAPANGADYLDIPVMFRGKVRLASLTGAGAIVNVWIE